MSTTEKRRGIVVHVPADSLVLFGDIVPVEGKPGSVNAGLCVVNGPEVATPGVHSDVQFGCLPFGSPGHFAKAFIAVSPEVRTVTLALITHAGWVLGKDGNRFVLSRNAPRDEATPYEVFDSTIEGFPGLAARVEKIGLDD